MTKADGRLATFGVGEMIGRLRWILLITAVGGCYFETPKHSARPDDNVDPVEGHEGGGSPEGEGGGPDDELDGEAVTLDASLDGGGLDGTIPGSEAGAGEAGAMTDGGSDAGPQCACDAGQVCLPGSAQCVECAGDKDCSSGAKAKCDQATHSCVACDAKEQCTRFAGLNVCAAGNCVQCSAGDQSACASTGRPVCATAGNTCVACNVHADCPDPNRAACEANTCRACRSDAECAGKVSGATTLDACYNGQCVDCRVSTTDTKMDVGCTSNNACNPATHACTGKAKNSLGICQACVADAECVADHRCVQMFYQSTPVGGFCMKVAMNCPDGYTAPSLRRRSLSGAAEADYCGIVESRTSCGAIRALVEQGTTCPDGDSASCNASGALCETVNAGATLRCTYACVDPIECSPLTPCRGPTGAKYCGGPP